MIFRLFQLFLAIFAKSVGNGNQQISDSDSVHRNT